jgi:hypothetical protein
MFFKALKNMSKKYQHFILRLMLVSFVTGLAAFFVDFLFPGNVVTPAWPWLISLFVLISAIVHYMLLKITEMNPRRFVGYFMLATFLKLFVYLIVIFIYLFRVKEGILPFILTFFAFYIIYTVFEVVALLSQTKDDHPKEIINK